MGTFLPSDDLPVLVEELASIFKASAENVPHANGNASVMSDWKSADVCTHVLETDSSGKKTAGPSTPPFMSVCGDMRGQHYKYLKKHVVPLYLDVALSRVPFVRICTREKPRMRYLQGSAG